MAPRKLPAGIAQDLITVLSELARRAYSQQIPGETVAAAVELERAALDALPDATPPLRPGWHERADRYLAQLEADAAAAADEDDDEDEPAGDGIAAGENPDGEQ